MKIYQIGLMALGIFIFSGCASKYTVRYESDPIGAVLVCQGERKFTMPTKTLYLDEEERKKHLYIFNPIKNHRAPKTGCSVNWISGYSMDLNSVRIEEFQNGMIITVKRPFGEGYEKDAQYALQLSQVLATRKAATDAANRQDWNDIYQMQQNYQLQQMNNNLNGIRYGY